MTAEGARKGEPSSCFMRYGPRPQLARLVRGSSRRIMTMRFRPANIRVINRRVCSSAAIGPAVQNQESGKHEWRERISPRLHRPNQAEGQGERNLRFLSPLESPFFPQRGSELTSGNVFPPSRPSKFRWMPERCSTSRVRFAAPNTGAPLTSPRRSGQTVIATGGSGGNTRRPAPKTKAGVPPVGRNAGPKQNTIKPGGA
jgi:hypothetical protein